MIFRTKELYQFKEIILRYWFLIVNHFYCNVIGYRKKYQKTENIISNFISYSLYSLLKNVKLW